MSSLSSGPKSKLFLNLNLISLRCHFVGCISAVRNRVERGEITLNKHLNCLRQTYTSDKQDMVIANCKDLKFR